MTRPQQLALFTVGTALALATRLIELGSKSIWLDEAWSWRAASISFGAMTDMTAGDNHPPLYYALLHLVVDVAGDSEAALRAPSAIAGALAIVLLVAATWRAVGPFVAVAAGTLLTVNGAFLEISQEARMYSLLSALAVAASWALGEYLVSRRPWLLTVYALLAILLVYVDYSAFILLAAHGLLLFGYGVRDVRSGRGAGLIAWAIAVFGAVGLAFLPWLFTFSEQLDRGAPLVAPDAQEIRTVARHALGLENAGVFWVPLAVGLLVAGSVVLSQLQDNPRLLALAALAAVPVGQLIVSAAITPVFGLRYVAPYIPGMLLVVALCIDALRRSLTPRLVPWAIVAPATLVAALAIVSGAGMVDQYREQAREDWRAAAREVRATEGTTHITPFYTLLPLSYYVRKPHDIVVVANDVPGGIERDLTSGRSIVPGSSSSVTRRSINGSPSSASSASTTT